MVLSFLKVTQESVRFRDVAVVFSSNQWVHLSFQERELYRDVMLDTCGGAFGLLVCACAEKMVRRRKQKSGF